MYIYTVYIVYIMLFLYFASENHDFTGSMWRVDFPAGVTEAEFTIPIVQDTSLEETEHFYLDLVIETPVDERVSAVDPSRQTVIIIITGVLVYTVHDKYYDTVYFLCYFQVCVKFTSCFRACSM